MRPVLLEGEAPARLWGALVARVEGAGYRVERAAAPHNPGANGALLYESRRVVVRPDLEPAQAARTLVHELAHALLDHATTPVARERAEVEAESVAYVVCAAAGLPPGAYSLPYVARWAGGDLAVVRAAAERVLGCARAILAAVETEAAAAGGEAVEASA